MADDEQFSLCWNNFNSNLSAGFHESLCRGDLVDVTLAAEGQFVKAHRLVLSVCSPYFRKMFTQMPANQHAFVFLKDVSHTALKDLIQFMYCGEVNVKQEALPAFISTAEALQIKGLTDSDPPPSQTPPEPSTPTPQLPQQIQTSPRVRQRPSAATRPYKIETVDDGGDDSGKQTTQIVIQTTATAAPQATMTAQAQTAQPTHLQTQQQQQHIQSQLTSVSMPTATTATVVTHKRPAQRTSLSSVPHVKRTKSTIDPLEGADATTTTQQISVQTAVVTESKAQVQQQQQQQQSEPEYIDLPIELPTKSEPDYADETGEVDQAEGDTAYVEDESYGDMRYDESYFTENEDAAPTAPTNVSVSNTPTGTTSSGNNAVGATTSKAIVKQQTTSFSDTSYVDTGDQTNNDAQDISIRTFEYSVAGIKLEVEDANETFLDAVGFNGIRKSTVKSGLSKRKPSFLESRTLDDWGNIKYVNTNRGNKLLFFEGQRFIKNNIYGSNIYWKCTKWHKNCKARAITSLEVPSKCVIKGVHNHPLLSEDWIGYPKILKS
ncbi:modifier of mdg4-like isoform X9 [Glossina fuscipes]|uniref:Modifier of mdg4-like isoform X9 n=1 Tax=Glossina fuscipes TaxID=7396 RepID=A0A8U0WK77_9MUSC|nr:modifier of mdg4-like isoform X9 [Glossina fuscipes]